MDKLDERMAELEADNNQLRQMIVILEKMSVDLIPFVMKCKCVFNSLQIQNNLNALKQEYNDFKQNNNIINNLTKNICKTITIEENDAIKHVFNSNFTEIISKLPKVQRRRGRPSKTRIDFSEDNTRLEIIDKKNLNITEKKQILNQKRNKILGKVCGLHSNQEKTNKRRNEKKVLCNECGKQFRDTYELRFHEWRHSGQKLFACDWPGCNKKFSSRYLLKHQKSHSDPKSFVCHFNDCKNAFQLNEELIQHFKESHSGHKPFKCRFQGCNQEFVTESNLLQHNNRIHSSKQYVCEWPGCESSFRKRYLLKDHTNSKHIGNIKYKCEWPGCEFSTGHNKSFTRHKLIHTGEKPFKCEFEGCVWRFRQPHQLKQHYLVHTGESPVCCQFNGCDQRFKTRRVMLSHFRKTHTLST